MPFGSESSSDRLPRIQGEYGQRYVTNAFRQRVLFGLLTSKHHYDLEKVTNAFRQRVLFGQTIPTTSRPNRSKLSPMPFGSESSSDVLQNQLDTILEPLVTNAFRQRVLFGHTPEIEDEETLDMVTNAFRQRVLFGQEGQVAFLKRVGLSPMPFGSESSSDSSPFNILLLSNANGL